MVLESSTSNYSVSVVAILLVWTCGPVPIPSCSSRGLACAQARCQAHALRAGALLRGAAAAAAWGIHGASVCSFHPSSVHFRSRRSVGEATAARSRPRGGPALRVRARIAVYSGYTRAYICACVHVYAFKLPPSSTRAARLSICRPIPDPSRRPHRPTDIIDDDPRLSCSCPLCWRRCSAGGNTPAAAYRTGAAQRHAAVRADTTPPVLSAAGDHQRRGDAPSVCREPKRHLLRTRAWRVHLGAATKWPVRSF